MNKIRNIAILFLIFFCFFAMPVFASSEKINSIDYNIVVTKDSKLEVTEVWNISLGRSNHKVIKSFMHGKIVSNVFIKEYNKDSSVKIEYEEVFEENSDPYKFYIKDNVLNINLDSSNNDKVYLSIEYVVEDAVNVYLDCAEFDFELQDKYFEYNSDEITGKISFEENVASLANFYTWIHSSSLSSVTKVDDYSSINFFIDGNSRYNKIDIKSVFPTNMINVDLDKVTNGNRLKFIFEEEILNNEKQAKESEKEFIINVIILVIGILAIIIVIVLIIVLIVKKKKEKNKDNNIDKNLDKEDKKEKDKIK